MITKERLEQLIEQGATVWRSMCGDIHKIRLDKRYFFCDDNKLCWHTIAKLMPRLFVDFEYLFETKEDAEWYVKYGKVTKTETISFPTYEKIMQDLEGKIGTYTIIDASNVLLEVNLGRHYVDQIYLYTKEDKFNWNLSKEGYEQACEMCVREFKK